MARNLIDDETFEFIEGYTKAEIQALFADVEAIKTALQQEGTKRQSTILWSGRARADGTIINLNDDPHNYNEIHVHYGYNGYGGIAVFSNAQFYSGGGVYIRIAETNKDDTELPYELQAIEYNIVKNNSDPNTTEYVLWSRRWAWDGVADDGATQTELGTTTVNSQAIYSIIGVKYAAAMSGE